MYDLEILCIIDSSGSMFMRKQEAITGFNEMLQEQKKLGDDASMTLVLFNSEPTTVFKNKLLSLVEELDENTYIPSGITALYDAIGYGIEQVDPRNKNVFVCIITDGMENASKQYKSAQIKTLIEERAEWNFMFIGASKDSIIAAKDLGIQQTHQTDQASSEGVLGTYSLASRSIGAYRTTK